ncbi:MAG: aminotransferase class V-fold PLP-dependent enzyme [Lactimicrobium massiliense]|nr:aminotransferase class V-fold PLP-dependent enzyme [Lactimicrobium massiliense]MDD6230464.1 aminotransferase class V-fold PLP-dependent enzyme [Lactimicrobium massiliense]
MEKIMMASDYQCGAYPTILEAMAKTNLQARVGYGLDEICERAKDRIRKACGCDTAEVEFLSGGTQANAVVIGALLKSYQGVISADSGHVSVHEAGAIEHGGHKVLPIKGSMGKISAQQIETLMQDYQNDGNHDHIVMPGMVYLSQPTEFGTLYSRKELEEISAVCHRYHLPLYVDGARLAYALAAEENDVTLSDLARLCDVFYIGGTKCGAFIGEAVVIPNKDLIPHFFTIIKQDGALLAKGWLLGIQFDELFKDDLYLHIGETAVQYADQIKKELVKDGYSLYFDSPTNQIFFVITNDKLETLGQKAVYSYMEKYDETHTVIRFATSWSTAKEDVDKLCQIIRETR